MGQVLIKIAEGHYIQVDKDIYIEKYTLDSDTKTSLTSTGNLNIKKGGQINVTNPSNKNVTWLVLLE